MNAPLKLKAVDIAPDALLLEKIEELLAQVASGEVQAVGYAALLRTGDVQTCIVNENLNVCTMLGALERLKFRYHNIVLNDVG